MEPTYASSRKAIGTCHNAQLLLCEIALACGTFCWNLLQHPAHQPVEPACASTQWQGGTCLCKPAMQVEPATKSMPNDIGTCLCKRAMQVEPPTKSTQHDIGTCLCNADLRNQFPTKTEPGGAESIYTTTQQPEHCTPFLARWHATWTFP